MGQLNFFDGEEENPPEVQRFWDEQSNPSPTPTPRQTPRERMLDEEPAPTREQPDYAQLAAINRYLRQPKNIPPNEEMRAEPVDWTLEDEIQDRVRRRLKREGLNPFQQEPGYEPDPPTNPRLPPKPQRFTEDRFPEMAQLGKQYDPNEVHYANELSPDDPRWEAFAKALGVNVDELKKKNLPSKFDQEYENMAQDMLRRVRERGYGESRLLNEKQADPDLVPIRAPYGGQRYYDPASSLGVDPIMAQQDWPGTPAS